MQACEGVIACAVSGGGADHIAAAIEKGDHHALDTGFARVLDAVVVEVLPHKVAQGSQRRVVADVPGEIVFASHQGGDAGLASGLACVAVFGVIGTLIRRADHVAREGQWHADIVVAGLEVGEQVVACGVRSGGADGDVAAVVEGDDHALNAGLASVLDAVAIEVEPNEVAEGSQRVVVTCVHREVVVASGKRDGDGLARANVGIAILVVGSSIGGGQQLGAHVEREAHGVVAGLQISEQVVTGSIGGGGAKRSASAVVKGDGHALDAGFAGILHAIAIGIEPDEIAQSGQRRVVTCVHGVVVFALRQGDVDRLAGAERSIAIRCIRADLIHWAEHESIVVQAQRELHGIGAGLQASEVIVTGGVGDRGAHSVATAIKQGNSDALDAGFAWVLDAVAVEVLPNEVADGSERGNIARVDGAVVFSGGEGDVRSDTRTKVGIAVVAGSACTWAGQYQAVAVQASRELHRIGAGLQIRELIVTGGIGGGGANSEAACIQERDGDALNTGFTRLLQTVLVEVEPDVVANRSERRNITGIEVGVVLRCGKNDGCGAARGLIGITIRGGSGVVLGGQYVTSAKGGGESYTVGAGLQIDKVVVAKAVGGGGANQGAEVIVEIDRHALDAGFASVLSTIAVEVHPHVVANGSKR